MMDDLEFLKKFLIFGLPLNFILILFLILIVNNSGNGDLSIISWEMLSIPFESDSSYTITSGFGKRKNPLNGEENDFHTGIDLATSKGTNVVSSGDGIVEKIGFEKNGLGNYVYIKHNFSGLILYTMYGHMLDDSIVILEGQEIKKGEKIGQVGTTGASTGYHLHFMITSPIASYEEKYLIDPTYVIKGIN